MGEVQLAEARATGSRPPWRTTSTGDVAFLSTRISKTRSSATDCSTQSRISVHRAEGGLVQEVDRQHGVSFAERLVAFAAVEGVFSAVRSRPSTDQEKQCPG
jgi:hypothetical protein